MHKEEKQSLELRGTLRVFWSSFGVKKRRADAPKWPLKKVRVDFLLITDSGYPKDTGVTLFTLAKPGNPLRYNTHRSDPTVFAARKIEGKSEKNH